MLKFRRPKLANFSLKKIFADFPLPAILNNGHWQTILPLYLTRYLIDIKYTRQRIFTSDSDFIDLDWVNPDVIHKPTLILFHGMEGNSQSHYAKRIMYYIHSIGWRGVVAHARGCSGELNQTLSWYHAGLTQDIAEVVSTISKVTPTKLFVAGVSLGGNALLKFLGEGNPAAAFITAATTVSVPFDLQQSTQTLDQGINRHLYVPYFMDSLLVKMQQYKHKFPEFSLYPNVKTINEFNELYITQRYNFKNALDYYQKSSSIYYLKTITTPTFMIQAANDPMILSSSWPLPADLSPVIRFLKLKHGGHAGFIGSNRNLKKALLRLPEIMVQYYKTYL